MKCVWLILSETYSFYTLTSLLKLSNFFQQFFGIKKLYENLKLIFIEIKFKQIFHTKKSLILKSFREKSIKILNSIQAIHSFLLLCNCFRLHKNVKFYELNTMPACVFFHILISQQFSSSQLKLVHINTDHARRW